MGKKRVYEFAKENKMASKDVLEKAKNVGINYSSHMSSMEDKEVEQLKKAFSQKSKSAGSQMKSNNSKKTKQNNTTSIKKANENNTASNKQADRPKKEHQNNAQTNKNSNVKQASQNKQTNKNNEKNSQHSKGQTNINNKKASSQTKNNQKKATSSASTGKANELPKRTTDEKQKQSFENKRRRSSRQHRGIHGGPAGARKRKGRKNQKPKGPVTPRKFKELPEILEFTDGMTIAELAKKLHREPAEIVKKLFMMGIMATQNQSLDKETIELLATEYGIETEEKVQIDLTDFDTFFEQEPNEDNLVTRPATVTIMGHVDHGKTTLLDSLRETKVTEGEAGGITQHIGAYQVTENGKVITFLDTPGHAAFTTMRARGADVTDIAIIVVAADDGVMPQTVEAINHAKAAEVPIIVAVNKVDKPGANPDRVMQELTEHGLIPEDWGGDTIFVQISALLNKNLEDLLEMILLVAEVEELKADPKRLAIGTVIEARLDKSQGSIATLLVQEGTLHQGEPIVVGNTFGRVRTMTNDKGRRVQEAKPSTPVEITGLNGTPQAGDRFVVFKDEKTARQVGEARAIDATEAQRSVTNKVTLENLFDSLEEGELKSVNVIIKADVQGSAEALAASLEKIEVEGVKIDIIHTGVGAINESDVTLASASSAIIIGFNVRPTVQAKESASREEVDIRTHQVIYNAIDEIEAAMTGMLDPEYEEQVTGQVTVRETYAVSKVGTIAGCFVTDGVIKRNSSIRLIRNGVVIHEGELSSLKRFKDDAKEVRNGYECGLTIEKYNDIEVDDVIEAFEMVEIKK
ncbi:MAG: translation initiation factor IF-2 [Alkalibacterium gilvum]|uniref:Translation initiation factor IF-2 n=2 Tax=Alkalibacterium TaxID=99906 RepID=A0A1H6QZK1_9LACT|nr:translation initiation factor IF-2 [Alkalibacterium gilvum]MDN6728593.1 translation initiation factor IF-2 [Alkalibacterium sp.]SEI49081.1 translation initiation factor IF-2 [Alkalibacterium gilvum]